MSKFPIRNIFQRLSDNPLDETMIFTTLAEAKDYAKNNPTAYRGQIIHVKDARTDKEIESGTFVYEESCFINSLKDVEPICSFTYEAMGVFFDLMYEILDGPTEETRNKLDTLKEIMYDNYTYESTELPTGDYYTQPWNPSNYSDNQICLEMTGISPDDYIGREVNTDSYLSIEGANYTIEDFEASDENGVNKYYKLITLDDYPTKVSFRGGTNIAKVIQVCDTSNITNMDYMFYFCKSLTYINTNNWNTSKVTSMREMFSMCNALITLDASSWNTSQVTDMYNLFYNCYTLTSLDLSSWNTSNVTQMIQIFYLCRALTSLNISNWDTSKATSMHGYFSYCDALTLDNIIMTNCSEETVTKITNAFNSK